MAIVCPGWRGQEAAVIAASKTSPMRTAQRSRPLPQPLGTQAVRAFGRHGTSPTFREVQRPGILAARLSVVIACYTVADHQNTRLCVSVYSDSSLSS